MTEQARNTEVQINEEEIGKLFKTEFRIMTVKMIKNLENKMEKMQESINKGLEELKNKHTETNNTITEIKNTLEGINSRISKAEGQMSELEDKMVEITSAAAAAAKSLQSCLTLCNPMNRSMPGLPIHHQLLEFTQIQVH